MENEEIGLNEIFKMYGEKDYVILTINKFIDTYDYDNDGLKDYYEVYRYFTDTENLDSDGDGILDGDWENRKKLVPK